MTMNRKLFAKGFRHGIPIGLGYLSVAFTFGMKAVADGLSPLEALLISMTNVTSAGQFAGLPLILAQASYLEVALTQLIINLRYALMSLSISQKMDSDMNTPRRLLFSFMNTDEIFAVASSQPGKVSHWYLYGLMTAPYLGWSVGTILGAVAGTLLPVFLRQCARYRDFRHVPRHHPAARAQGEARAHCRADGYRDEPVLPLCADALAGVQRVCHHHLCYCRLGAGRVALPRAGGRNESG